MLTSSTLLLHHLLHEVCLVYISCILTYMHTFQVFADDSDLLPRLHKSRIPRPFRRRRLLSHEVTSADHELFYGSTPPHPHSFSAPPGLISSAHSSPYAPFSSPAPLVVGGNYNNHNNSLHHHYSNKVAITTAATNNTTAVTQCVQYAVANSDGVHDTGTPERSV